MLQGHKTLLTLPPLCSPSPSPSPFRKETDAIINPIYNNNNSHMINTESSAKLLQFTQDGTTYTAVSRGRFSTYGATFTVVCFSRFSADGATGVLPPEPARTGPVAPLETLN